MTVEEYLKKTQYEAKRVIETFGGIAKRYF